MISVSVLCQAATGQDLKAARAQPDPVKRAKLALGNGNRAASGAADACRAGERENCNSRLQEALESVVLAHESLDQSGIDPLRSPRHFKSAEMETRKIHRALADIRPYIDPDDVSQYESVLQQISKIHDDLLTETLVKRHRK